MQLCNADCFETGGKLSLPVFLIFVSIIDLNGPRAGECVDVYSVIEYWAKRKLYMRSSVGDELLLVPS